KNLGGLRGVRVLRDPHSRSPPCRSPARFRPAERIRAPGRDRRARSAPGPGGAARAAGQARDVRRAGPGGSPPRGRHLSARLPPDSRAGIGSSRWGIRPGPGAGSGAGAAPGVPRARVGLDVPIETKLHAPNPRTEWVDRPGLISFLARTDAKLVLVCAPAGFGKTTLVAQWRAGDAENRAFAWVSLDRGDDDPGRLWWHVACALQRACPQISCEGILRALRVPEPKITGAVLPALINELAALPVPVVLVLDDYHVISERDCHEQIAFLLRHMPPSLQIVLVTRAQPQLPLAHLRTAKELAEIRAADLRFTAGQAATLINSVADVRLSDADLADLMERTE